ncbi:GNAT family N-acetyltransferase [Clostridium mediterraneense]|uniref:GNAT family N-acetyltransferase n=1 Tax=Clostridium mediterraneense TaxID=1805472 RepID=UPI000834598A|nr:GNAT family N-acetyltransferase [Clostridium mediterraneense]
MEFRKSIEADIDRIMIIIKQAQNYFKENNIDQWQNNYPNAETIRNDIKNNDSYVLIKDGEIVATTALSFDGDSNYDHIYDGSWLSNNKFAVIHRIAVDNKYKGLGLSSEIIKKAEKMCLEREVHSIKVDTHKDNLSMQKLLKKNNFKYCGVIYVSDGTARVAFEKLL